MHAGKVGELGLRMHPSSDVNSNLNIYFVLTFSLISYGGFLCDLRSMILLKVRDAKSGLEAGIGLGHQSIFGPCPEAEDRHGSSGVGTQASRPQCLGPGCVHGTDW